jgi:WD40 repeat-containing protein SMU1
MLKEFHGHTSYVNTCQYVLPEGGSSQLRVVTGSADGTVRVWDGKSAEIMYVLRPASMGSKLSVAGSSVVLETRVEAAVDEGTSPNVHSVLSLHTPAQSLIIVPRGTRAFLVTLNGLVVRTFDGDGSVFVAATVSPSNRWLYAVTEAGDCCIFDVVTGFLEKKIRDFALESGREKEASEVSGLVHHPHVGMIAAFSSSKSQKRGMLTLWK